MCRELTDRRRNVERDWIEMERLDRDGTSGERRAEITDRVESAWRVKGQ